MSARAAPRLPIGATIGRDLTVLAPVDTGGPDRVYIVWNHRAWCPMACKTFADPRRARREARVLAAIEHPNIVRCLGADRPGYVLMDFLEGRSLAGMIERGRRGRLAPSDALRVAIYLAAAASHMHDRGYLHLDIKPANVIIVAGRPVLFDVGVARARRAWRGRFLAGTDEYMSPEQCRRAPVSPASDVFGLGVTLYEMLTGRLPFPRATRRRPFPQLTVDATPIRHRCRTLPAALARLVDSCLARDPKRRPASPASLIPALHRHIRVGPRMWPPGFDPVVSPASRRSGRRRRIP